MNASETEGPPRMTRNVLAFSVDALLGHKPKAKQIGTEPDQENHILSKWNPCMMPPFNNDATSLYTANSLTNLTHHPANFARNITNLTYKNEDIQLELCGKELWTQFHRLENEMIITKAGRRMFPALKIKVIGLDPDAHYIFWVDVVSLDDNRYRYVYPSSQWMVAGTGDPPMPFNQYIHPDCPSVGRHWMMQFISFDRLKLTNNKQPSIKGQIALHSMHKYQPRIHVQKTNDLQTDPELQIDEKKSLTFVFPETAFITVTAYQNQQITRLKIASNPFAKGFRETVRSRDENDQYESSRMLAGRPHFNFSAGVTSVLLPPHPLQPYGYFLPPPALCNPSFYPYCFVESCPTSSSGGHFIGATMPSHHATLPPLSGTSYLHAEQSRVKTDNFHHNAAETVTNHLRYKLGQSPIPSPTYSDHADLSSSPRSNFGLDCKEHINVDGLHTESESNR